MNLKKSITWAVTGLFIFASALSAEEIKGDKTAGKTNARMLAKSGMADDGPTSTFFNINSWKIQMEHQGFFQWNGTSCLLYTSPSPRDRTRSRMPSSA